MTSTDHFGIVVFSHLHWGIVWQRLQVPLAVRAKAPNPLRRRADVRRRRGQGAARRDAPGHAELHRRLPARAGVDVQEQSDGAAPVRRKAIECINENSAAFDQPLLWYCSPMNSASATSRTSASSTTA